MVRWAFVVVAFIALVAVTYAQDLPLAPQGPSPNQMLATAVKKDGADVIRFFHLEKRIKKVQVERDGKKVDVDFIETQWTPRTDDLQVDAKGVAFFTADGKAIDPKALLKRLAKPTRVVVFYFEPKEKLTPDPAYLRMLREDVVVIARQ